MLNSLMWGDRETGNTYERGDQEFIFPRPSKLNR